MASTSSSAAPTSSLRPYINKVRASLSRALCIVNFPCQQVERHNRPEIEYDEDPELILEPELITGGEGEACLIEPSINSARISLRLRQSDALEVLLTKKYVAALMQKADAYDIVRRVPLDGYDVSFLITSRHVETHDRLALAALLCQFVEEAHAEVGELKQSIRARSRQVAADYKKALVLPQLVAKYNAVSPPRRQQEQQQQQQQGSGGGFGGAGGGSGGGGRSLGAARRVVLAP